MIFISLSLSFYIYISMIIKENNKIKLISLIIVITFFAIAKFGAKKRILIYDILYDWWLFYFFLFCFYFYLFIISICIYFVYLNLSIYLSISRFFFLFRSLVAGSASSVTSGLKSKQLMHIYKHYILHIVKYCFFFFSLLS